MRTRRFQRICRALACPMMVVTGLASSPLGAARATMVATDRMIAPTAAPPGGDRDRVIAFVRREEVRRQLAALGVAPDEAAARVAGLTDDEVQVIAEATDRLPAGREFVGNPIALAILLILAALYGLLRWMSTPEASPPAGSPVSGASREGAAPAAERAD